MSMNSLPDPVTLPGAANQRESSKLSPPPSSSGQEDRSTRGEILAQRAIPVLTSVSHGSALVFSSFLVVHLAAPIASAGKVLITACTGGRSGGSGSVGSSTISRSEHLTKGSTDAASRWMLLGRVYYQGALSEPVIVWGSLATHLVSSVLKRAALLWLSQRRRQRRQKEPESKAVPSTASDDQRASSSLLKTSRNISMPTFSLPSANYLHAVTGYALLPALLAHTLLTRIVPSSTEYPINALSPSELDYTVITYGLSRERASYTRHLSWAVLAGMTGIASWHVAGGVHLITQRQRLRAKARRSTQPSASGVPDADSQAKATKSTPSAGQRRRKDLARTAAPSLLGSGLVLAGVWAMSIDPEARTSIQGWTGKRLQAVYAATWPWSWS